MIGYAPRLTEAHARDACETGRWRAFRARIRPASADVFQKIEAIWLPCRRFDLHYDSNHGPSEIAVSVEARAGSPMPNVALEPEPLDPPPPAAAVFAPCIGEAEAEALARKHLANVLLIKRGKKPSRLQLTACRHRLIHWPLWVYHYRRRGRWLDFHLVDAVTGEKLGHKLKAAMLQAFIQQAESQPGA